LVDRRGFGEMHRRQRRGTAAVRPPLDEDLTINVCLDPVDFRMGINGLSVLIEASLKYDPFSRNLFCFTNKRKNQIKVLYWERSGFCLWLKRLEEERFKWPTHMRPDGEGQADRSPVARLTQEQLSWLLDGLDLRQLKPHRALEYRTVL
jgi:transposase